jgi:PAS domain S-box-containing protein
MPTENQTNTRDTLATMFFDEAYRCIYANAKACQLMGYTATEFYVMDLVTIRNLTHPDDITPWDMRSMAIENPQFVGNTERQRFFRKDGTIILLDKTITISRDIEGHPIVIVATLVEV